MELYFNLYKIKYTKLMELLSNNDDINIGPRDTVNVYINLEPIFIKMCNPSVDGYLKTNSKTSSIEFISYVINLAAHYRWFFTKNKIKSNIYLYFPSLSTTQYKNKLYNDNYRMLYRFKLGDDINNILLYKLIINSVSSLQLILEYIEGVYLLDSHNIENSVIPYVINEEKNNNDINFIISTSLYDFQYVNFDYYVLVPKQDNSVVITKRNVIPYLEMINEIKGTYTISSKMLPFMLSIVGSKLRNIYNIKGMQFKNTFKLIQRALDEKLITNNSTNIYMLSDVLKQEIQKAVINNYHCTDIVSQYNQLNKKDIHDITSQIKDKFDNISLKKLNDRYFKEFPIMLMEITATPNGKNVKF